MKNILVSFFYVYSAILIEWKRFLWKIFRRDIYRISIFKGFTFNLVGKGDITQWLYQLSHLVRFDKSFESKTLGLFVSYLKDGDTVLDIGANIGMFSLIASKIVKKGGIVHSFEPSKAIYEILNENLKINKCENVFTHKLALSDLNGEITLTTPITKYGNDAFAFISNTVKEPVNNFSSSERTLVKTLDQFILENGITKVDIIKIDIEGAELLCFKGANNLLSTTDKPIILFEALEELCYPRFGYSVIELLKFLDEKDYDICQFENWQWVATPKKIIK